MTLARCCPLPTSRWLPPALVGMSAPHWTDSCNGGNSDISERTVHGLEYSLKTSARNWVSLNYPDGKKPKVRRVSHVTPDNLVITCHPRRRRQVLTPGPQLNSREHSPGQPPGKVPATSSPSTHRGLSAELCPDVDQVLLQEPLLAGDLVQVLRLVSVLLGLPVQHLQHGF